MTAPGTSYETTAERFADIIAERHTGTPAIAAVAGEMPSPVSDAEVRARLRAEIAAARHDTPIILGPGGLTAGSFLGGILADAGPDVYEALAEKFTGQAIDAFAGGDQDLGQALLADARTALTLAHPPAGGAS